VRPFQFLFLFVPSQIKLLLTLQPNLATTTTNKLQKIFFNLSKWVLKNYIFAF